jgi:hypothetical protein
VILRVTHHRQNSLESPCLLLCARFLLFSFELIASFLYSPYSLIAVVAIVAIFLFLWFKFFACAKFCNISMQPFSLRTVLKLRVSPHLHTGIMMLHHTVGTMKTVRIGYTRVVVFTCERIILKWIKYCLSKEAN